MSAAAARPPVVAVVGATATGKSALAVALAHALDGEVVNGDALQFYRGTVSYTHLTLPTSDLV